MKMLSKLIEMIAYAGAGAASVCFSYQPKLPESLR